MDKKTQFVINDISKYGVVINSIEFIVLYYNKYFSGFKFEDNDVKIENVDQYNNILKKLFINMIEDHKNNRNIFIGAGIGVYFLGAFVRDFLLDYIEATRGDLFYIIAYAFWVYGFAWFLIKAYNEHSVSKGIQKYIQNDIKDDLRSNNPLVTTSEIGIETKLLKLKEMYDNKLITEEEYNSLRMKAIEKL